MHKKKIIKIKNPLFKKIRNNLRTILIKFVYQDWERIFKEQEDLLMGEDGPRKLTSRENLHFRKLQENLENIEKMVDRSICRCPVCQQTDQDMVFNPVTKVWFCVYCYIKNQEYYKHSAKYAHLFP